jgi:uncharacterized protein involved in exopolysaccharide biosynthesis
MQAAGQQALEPTLADVLHDFWQARAMVVLGALAGLFAGFVFLQAAVPQYKAEMLIAPAGHAGTAELPALLSENTGAAMQLMLQSFNTGDSSDFMRFEAILREPTIAARLLHAPAVRDGLAKAKRWRFLPAPPLDTASRLSAWLQENLEVEPVGSTHLRRIVFRHPDPGFSVALLRLVYDTADGLMQAEMEEKTRQRIAYLEKAAANAVNPDHKRTLTRLLMDQEQIAVILAVHEPFAATLAEPPAASAKPDWPRRPLVICAFVLAGAFIGYSLYGLRRAARGA